MFDFALRLAFFALAPFLLVFAAQLFPIGGALAQMAIATSVFFAGEGARRLTARSRFAERALAQHLAFEAYYRARRPRPFLYYVFYPLLFPYWLAVPEARREFLLFKGYTLASFALLLGSLIVQYARRFPPELGLRDFAPLAAIALAVETAVVLMFLMPLVTSVVECHLARTPRRLAALLAFGTASVIAAVILVERRRDPIVSIATRVRLRARTDVRPDGALAAQRAGLVAAFAVLPPGSDDVEQDGKVVGAPLERARAALHAFYKDDEAAAFDLWYTRRRRARLLVLYAEPRGRAHPVWLGMTDAGAIVRDERQLPKGAFAAMWRATR